MATLLSHGGESDRREEDCGGSEGNATKAEMPERHSDTEHEEQVEKRLLGEQVEHHVHGFPFDDITRILPVGPVVRVFGSRGRGTGSLPRRLPLGG